MHLLHQDLTSLILKTFYEVYNELGYGFLEKVYQNALLIELRKNGLEASQNKKIKVYYKGENVGDYYADIIELKIGNSIKTSLGSAATGLPSALMGINKNNTGISDYSLGFEIEFKTKQNFGLPSLDEL